MTSNKPYLIRALYEWIVDNHNTPYIQVEASITSVQVPRNYVKNNQIVLNIAMQSVKDLTLGNDIVEFHARFDGRSEFVSVPVGAIAAIFSKENGQGMGFDVVDEGIQSEGASGSTEGSSSIGAGSNGSGSNKASHLKVIK